ncbi:MAG: transcription antitermination factor NusB [Kiritimatiellae bacterium]|nr:transcription antitermination factor NusB [Kiritimatiellia bacterium]
MQTTRRHAREWAVQMLTAADLNPPEDIAGFIESYWETLPTLEDGDAVAGKPGGKMRKFAEERVFGVLSSLDEIDAVLVELLENWDLYRLGTVERVVLRMGIWELKVSDVPRAVVINEAIDLVNWYSTPKSRMIVNGVLDRYAAKVGR